MHRRLRERLYPDDYTLGEKVVIVAAAAGLLFAVFWRHL